MKRQMLTGLGIIELGALAVLWRSTRVAPLVEDELDVELTPSRPRHDLATARAARAV